MQYFHAAILESIGSPLVVRELRLPSLLRGQVLVKILFSGVCRSQLMEVSGGRGQDKWLPHLLGHEGSGIVISVGDGVTKVKPGDEVILGWLKSSGLEAFGAKYYDGKRIINSGAVTTFSNYTITSENRLTLKPKLMPFDVAVLFGCALPTGAGIVFNQLMPSKYSSVVVVGLGGIGLSALVALKSLGVKKIIAVDVISEKLKLAKSLGATHVFSPSDINFRSEIIRLTSGGADFCVESGGRVETIELGFSLIRTGGGRMIFASHPPQDDLIRISPYELISGKQLEGSWGGQSNPDRDVSFFYSLFCKANIPLEALLTKRYKLNEINQAMSDLEDGNVFRPLIVMDHPKG